MKVSQALLMTAVVFSFSASADLLLPRNQVSVSGPEATKMAQLVITGGDQNGTYAKGHLEVSCVKKPTETDFTCAVKVANPPREPSSVPRKK